MEKVWLNKYESGVPHSIEYPSQSLYGLYLQSVESYKNKTAVHFMGRELSYGELNAQVNSFASALADLGVKRGDPVALHLPNSTQFVISYLAVLSLGGIVVPCNPMYVSRELEHQLKDSAVETIITLTRFYNMVKEIQPRTNINNVVVTNIKDYFPTHKNVLYTLAKEKKAGDRVAVAKEDHQFIQLIGKHSGQIPPRAELRPDDQAVYLYTGGTTGMSKGAILQHRNLVANVYQVKSWCTDFQDDAEIILGVLPFFHSYGLTTVLNLGLLNGCKLVLLPRFELENLLKAIDSQKPTIFPGVPSFYVAINNVSDLKKYDLSSVRFCISGAAPLPVEVQKKFEENTGGKLVEGYGLTETSPVTHANPVNGERKAGSIGLPMPDTEQMVVDTKTGDEELPANETGELCVRGPQVMEGYLNMPEETRQCIRNGWFYTGDIAKIDEEGYAYIVERKKDMFIYEGLNIYPSEIEDVLYKYPKIKEAAVAGVKDPIHGNTLKAYIVVKDGENITEEEVFEHLKANLAQFKIPKIIDFRKELPKTMIGKVLRRALRAEEEGKDMK